jgi:hypothetical protein
VTERRGVAHSGGMAITFSTLVDGQDWAPMSLDQQNHPKYFWKEYGSLLADAPVSFEETFRDAMWVTQKPIDVPGFNRNPLRVRPNYTVPRHYHNMDEMIMVFEGYYDIVHDDENGNEITRRVGPGEFFISRAGTPYTMIAGPEGVVYIETWPKPVTTLETVWLDVGWVPR